MSVAPAGLKIHTRFSHGLEAGQKYYPDFLHERCERRGRSKQRNQRRGNTCIIYYDMHEPLKMRLKCVIKANLNPRQCWPVVSPRVLVWGDQGFCVQSVGAPHGLQLGLACQVICVSLFQLDSLHCDFIPSPPLPLALVSMCKYLCFHSCVSVMVPGEWLLLTELAFGSV